MKKTISNINLLILLIMAMGLTISANCQSSTNTQKSFNPEYKIMYEGVAKEVEGQDFKFYEILKFKNPNGYEFIALGTEQNIVYPDPFEWNLMINELIYYIKGRWHPDNFSHDYDGVTVYNKEGDYRNIFVSYIGNKPYFKLNGNSYLLPWDEKQLSELKVNFGTTQTSVTPYALNNKELQYLEEEVNIEVKANRMEESLGFRFYPGNWDGYKGYLMAGDLVLEGPLSSTKKKVVLFLDSTEMDYDVEDLPRILENLYEEAAEEDLFQPILDLSAHLIGSENFKENGDYQDYLLFIHFETERGIEGPCSLILADEENSYAYILKEVPYSRIEEFGKKFL